jgi:hypothetical protein
MQPSMLWLPAAFTANRRPLPPPPPLPLPPGHHHLHCTTVVKLTIFHCQRKATAAAHQHTNGSTNVKTFTSPDDLDLFNLSTIFEVYDDG